MIASKTVKTNLTTEQIAEITSLYTNENYGAVKIASMFKISSRTAKKILAENNVLVRSKNEANKLRLLVMSDEIVSQIIKLYVDEKLGTLYIANEYNVAPRTIRRILRENNVTVRARGTNERRKPQYAICHPDQFLRGNGLCNSCYQRDYNNKRKLNKKYAICHPERQDHSEGKCRPCYQKDLQKILDGSCLPLRQTTKKSDATNKKNHIVCSRCNKIAFWQEQNNRYFCCYCKAVTKLQNKKES
jgi:uncharacterized alkaline shock family protein YloU